MSDWDKFKTVGNESRHKDSKGSLISGIIFTTVLCGILGGFMGLLVVLYIANSNDHQIATMMAESNDSLPIEKIQAIIIGGVVVGLLGGIAAGIKIFTPHLLTSDEDDNDDKPVRNRKVDDPFDDDMRG